MAPSRMMAETAVLTIEDFVHRDPAAAVLPFLAGAGRHTAQRVGQHGADLRLLVRGKTSIMRSTVLRALFVCRVPKTSRPVSAAVSASGDGLKVAHFADEHDVGILPQGGLQAGGKVSRMLGHLALRDDAAFVP